MTTAQSDGKWSILLKQCRIGLWQGSAAFALLLVIVFARAPLRQIPDALFVSDGFGYYIFLPSLVLDRDLDFSNQLGRVPYEAAKSYFDQVPKTGLRANPFPVGPAVLWLPFFVLGHLAALGLRTFGAGVSLSGFGYVYELPAYCGAFLYGLAGLWLLQRLVFEMFSERIANTTLFAMLCCTPYAYYLWIEPDVSHVQAAFALALFLYTLWRAMRRRDTTLVTWIGVGASLGLVALVRPYNGLIAAATLPAVWYVCRSRTNSALDATTRLAACALAALVVFLPQVVIATALYGEPMLLPPGTAYERMTWTRPDFLGLAVSVFSYFPLLFVAFYGLMAPRHRGEGGRLLEGAGDAPGDARDAFLTWVRPVSLVAFLGVMYIVASYPRGSNYGDSFGQRRIVDWVPLLAIGFASCLASVREHAWPRMLTALLVLGGLGAVVTVLYTLKLLPEWGMAGLIG